MIDEIIKIISNPAISALIGAVLGSISTFAVGSLIEHFKNRRFKINIKKLIKTELAYYRNFLETILKEGKNDPTEPKWVCVPYKSDLALRMTQVMTDPFNNRLNPQNYPKLKIETKALALDKNNLIDVEETYFQISMFRTSGGKTIDNLGHHLFDKSKINQLIDKIKKTEAKI